MTATATHRENTPPPDLATVRRRIEERRAAALAPMSDLTRAIIDADTDLIEELAAEIYRVRAANQGLRDVLSNMKRGT